MDSLAYSEVVVAPDGPIKEGHTFSSWVNLPETMPITDVTVVATFVKNKYLLSYVVDGVTIQSDSVAYGTEIVMKEAPEKSGYTFDGWDKTVEVMPAEDVVINGSYTRLPVENFFIIDGNDSEFSLTESLQCNVITYTRTLNNTEWNALYLPFEIPVSQLTDKYEVAYINAIHSYDEDDNGEIDRMSMEVIKLREGILHANHPYLIKARTAAAKQMSITVENTTLHKAESRTLDCSSVYTKFEITGIYEKMTSAQLAGCYALSGGSWKNLASGSSLNPFRLYLRVSSREGSPVKLSEAAMARIGIHVQGEETATSVEERLMRKQHKGDAVYDLSGRRVTSPKKGQTYIVNGKKRMY